MKNGLIIFKENIFEKIKKWFKNLFSFKKNAYSEISNEDAESEKLEQDKKSDLLYSVKENDKIIINEEYVQDIANEAITDDFEYQIEEIDTIDFFPEPDIKFDYKERDKNVFFELYENVKLGKINYAELSFDDYIKIQTLLKYETKLKKQKI